VVAQKPEQGEPERKGTKSQEAGNSAEPVKEPVVAEVAQAYLQSIVDTVREPMLVLDAALSVVSASRSFYRTFRVTSPETEGNLLYELGNGQWDIPALRTLLEDILPSHHEFNDFEVTHDFPHIGQKTILLNARRTFRPGNGSQQILLAMEDVTERHRLEAERATAFEELQVAYERERRIAQTLQEPLKLEVAPHAFPGIEIATLYEAAWSEADIGGDLFDAFALPRGLVGLAVADASGKGLTAAARAIQVKEVLRAFCREYPHAPNQIVVRLNDFVCDTRRFDDRSDESFVCLSLAILDPVTGEGGIVSAGCEPPAILRANGTVESISVQGLPLGIRRENLYMMQPFHLVNGDILLLVTDGITEARRNRRFLGYEGMLELAQQHRPTAPPEQKELTERGDTLRAMGQAILEGAKAFAGGTLRDDACLLLFRKL
jgi:serine phosphatase RsbU (regulator of sigma subunit)